MGSSHLDTKKAAISSGFFAFAFADSAPSQTAV
jgi:hypothetical protein